MESGVQTLPTSPLSPLRVALLPPILSKDSSPPPPPSPAKTALQAASTELRESMGHLLSEAQSAESRIQHAMEALWKRMMEILEVWSKEQEQQQTALREECSVAREKLNKLLGQEAALVQQNARMTMELVSREKKQEKLEAEAGELRNLLAIREKELETSRREAQGLKERKESEARGLKKELEEKKRLLVEYQDKISGLTEKVQRVTRQLASEKASTEQERKKGSDKVNQQGGEIRKMALEISKLKSQLASSSTALAAAREENKKLDSMLRSTQSSTQEQLSSLRKHHSSVVEALEKKIQALERELERLRSEHQIEIVGLSEQLQKAHLSLAEYESAEDGLDARIRFLKHQNQQEKVKLNKERKLKH